MNILRKICKLTNPSCYTTDDSLEATYGTTRGIVFWQRCLATLASGLMVFAQLRSQPVVDDNSSPILLLQRFYPLCK
ncbi:Uncharacterised protein [Mycobacterium tuberculosis]|nr:Uncharacterised protein [Mycobacterium tuberculosis]